MPEYHIKSIRIRVSARKGEAGFKTVYRVVDNFDRCYAEEDTAVKATAHIAALVAADARDVKAAKEYEARQ